LIKFFTNSDNFFFTTTNTILNLNLYITYTVLPRHKFIHRFQAFIMSADKRQFSDFTKFPGEIEDGTYTFPRLYHTDSNENTRKWEIKVRLIKGGEKKYGIDWDLMLDDVVPVQKKHLEGEPLPEGTVAQMWVETGVMTGKLSRHQPTYPKTKNAGRSNERNPLEQGLVEARSHYLKRVENGLVSEAEFLKSNAPTKKGKKSTKKSKIKHEKYFPMLVRKYEDEKKRMEYPMYVQTKLDGARMVVYLNKSPKENPTSENVIMYTRQKKDYAGFDPIRKELLPALIDMWDFTNNESIYLDGELYKHGMSLQDISGAVRNPKRAGMAKYQGIKYHMFDIFYPSSLHLPFEQRLEYLNDVFCGIEGNPKCTVQVRSYLVKNEKAQDDLYKKFLKDKYEGAILRNSDSLYLAHPTKNSTQIRSKFVLKRKMKYSAEYEVVDYAQGTKGRDKGAIMWVCQTNPADKEKKKTFNVTPKDITYEKRYAIYKKASANKGAGFNERYKGRMMTVEYEDLSKDGVPLRAKAVGFREHV
jgi:ATP-dependent DNA ligase